MPSQRPAAAFDPIPPDFDLDDLVQQTPSFEYVARISYDMVEDQGLENFEKLVLLHVIIGGKPLVIEGFNKRLDKWTFTSGWLRDNCGRDFQQARDLSKQTNLTLSMSYYLDNMAKLTNQWDRHNYRDRNRQRIYMKDIDCPDVWHEKLKETVPPCILYLNDSIGDIGGPGSVEDPNLGGPGMRKTRGVARAGDLMSSLPPAMRAQNLMCYIGHEGTYTPAHREMCASLGQNLMVEASGMLDPDGKPTRPGSSIWFMTETKDRHLVSEYWLSKLGHDIEIESHFAQINAWKSAPFNTYIVEQKVGDFILIPPLAPHQVWNRGTRTMKVAWNRTTVETLEMALSEALPRARMVGRDEQYKNKAIIYFSLEKYSNLLKHVDHQRQISSDQQLALDLKYSPKIRQLQKDFRRLFALYTQVILSEMLAPVGPNEKKGQFLPYDSNVTCSFCRCNIFNRFLTCTTCVIPYGDGEEDTYDICLECYTMGRSCKCISGYKWVEQFHWQDLVQKHERWRQQIIAFDGAISEKSPQPLHTERKTMKKKTLAQVCQEQLRARPWIDPTKPAPQERPRRDEGDETQVNDDGTIAKRKRQVVKKGRHINHVTNYQEPKWKLAICGCGRAYSYGSLFRAFDLMPLTVMENPDWQCPHCLRICSCGKCRKIADMKPFEPTETVLGYDTKRVADPRSTESLVDFRQSNFEWVKKAGDDHPDDNRRLSRRVTEAEAAKSHADALDDDHYVNGEEGIDLEHSKTSSLGAGNGSSNDSENIPIDPLLSTCSTNAKSNVLPDQRNKPNGQASFTEVNGVTFDRASHPGFTTDADGIVYQYPDPTDNDPTIPLFAPPEAGIAPSFTEPILSANAQQKQSEKLLNDPIELTHVNGQYQKTQINRALAEARRNDRYIIAEAAISGKSLRVKIPLGSAQLARIRDQPRPDMVIIKSDFPSAPGGVGSTKAKKRFRVEQDDDFSTRKSRRRSTTNQLSSADGSRNPSKYLEISSDSEPGDDVAAPDVFSNNKVQKPRQLPAYLARKNRDSTPQTPKELSAGVSPRNSRKKTNVSNSKQREPTDAGTRQNTNTGDKMPIGDVLSSQHREPDPDNLKASSTGSKSCLEAAARQAEANRKAKLRALQGDDAYSDDDSSASEHATRVPQVLEPLEDLRKRSLKKTKDGSSEILGASIFSRPGTNGKKIKIVSAYNSKKVNLPSK
ncbi:MAG: hypothetical protein LQ342_001785 [Letrouitia transgressa]|nr:MAG: hypothetical protein LQ342_001785 [Letrouitia transgressa]